MANLNGRESIISEGNSYGLPIFCYCNHSGMKSDDRAFTTMEDFFNAFPGAEVTALEAVDGEVRVYC